MNNSISLSHTAIAHLQENLKHSPTGTVGIRIGLRDAGCSGFAYTVEFTNQIKPSDKVFGNEQVKIIVSEDYYPALKGTNIDLVQNGLNSVLEFNNPNVSQECGCGESFQIKN